MKSGTVYLLHFDAPVNGGRHYVGWTARLDARLAAHRAGTGARITRRAVQLGVGIRLARTWEEATREHERRLKSGYLWRGRGLCPLCTAEAVNERPTGPTGPPGRREASFTAGLNRPDPEE